MLSKKPEVLRLIGVDVHKFTREQILAALKSGQDKCHNEFLAKVSELQLLEEAVASELVRGHHPLLSKPATGSGPTGSSSVSGNTKVAPKARPPQLRSSHAADNAKGGSVLPGMSQHKDTANTFDTDRAAFGSTVARTFDVGDMGVSGGHAMDPSSDRWAAGAATKVEPARQQAQRYTEPSLMHNASRNQSLVDSQAMLDSGQVGQVLGLSVGAAVSGREAALSGRGAAREGAQDGPASDVARHRGAQESSTEEVDGNTVGPHQLRHASLHSTELLLHALLCMPACVAMHVRWHTCASAAG